MQVEHVFSWRPGQLAAPVRLTIGLEACRLTSTPATRRVDRHWRLNFEETEHPHPLIISIERYRSSIRVEHRLHHFHMSSLPNTLSGKIDRRPDYAGLVFRSPDCEVPVGQSRFSDVLREVSLLLGEIR